MRATSQLEPSPWVIVWTDPSPDHRAIPAPFDRKTNGRCPFDRAVELARKWTTVDRVAPVVMRPERPWWARSVEAIPAENVVEQPFDRGTAPGLLLAALRIRERDPDACVVLLGASYARVRRSLVARALRRVDEGEDIVLLEPPEDVDDGTVVPMQSFAGRWLLARPRRLRGVIVAKVSALVQMIEDTQPELARSFADLSGSALFDDLELDQLYPFLPDIDFEADVLAGGSRPEEPVAAERLRASV